MENPKDLDSAAESNIITGILLLCKEALVTAIQDSRLHRGHLRVLAAIAHFMNYRTAKAWPSRAAIADSLAMPVKSVSNLLLELRGYGYLIAERQAIEECNNRRLTVYTFGNIDRETIERTLTDIIMSMRSGPNGLGARATQSPVPAGKSRPSGTSEVPSQRDFERPKVPSQRESPVPAGLLEPESPVPAGYVTIKKDSTALEPADGAATRKRAANRSRLSADWVPAKNTIDWVRDHYVASDRQISEQAKKFRDHHLAKGSLMADWPAAWRTWWSNGYHKIPRRIGATDGLPAQGEQAVEQRRLAEQFELARKMDEEAERCRP